MGDLEKAAKKYHQENQYVGDSLVQEDRDKDSFFAGAKWMEEQYHCTYAELSSVLEDCNKPHEIMYTKDDMFMWAGYCAGRRMMDPTEDVTVVFEDYIRKYKQNQDARI